MVFEDPLVYKCESCGEKRSGPYIGTMTRKGMKNNKPLEVQITYCIDNGHCIDTAAKHMKRAFETE